MAKSELEMAMEKVREVNRLYEAHKAEGLSMKEACKKAGIKNKYYDKWSKIINDLYETDDKGELRLKTTAQPAAAEPQASTADSSVVAPVAKAPGRISVPISEENYRVLERLAAKRKMQVSQLAAYGLSRAIEQDLI